MRRMKAADRQKMRMAREAKGLSQTELGKIVGTSQQQIGRIESGEVQRSSFLPLIERALELKPGELTLSEIERDQSDNGRVTYLLAKPKKLAIHSIADAAFLREDIGVLLNANTMESVSITDARDNLVAFKVEGRSVDLVFPEGTIIIVDPSDTTLIDGLFYIFMIHGQPRIKKFQAEPRLVLPASSDPSFDAMELPKDAEVLGRIVLSQRSH